MLPFRTGGGSDRAVAGRAAEQLVLCYTEMLQHSSVAVARLLGIGCAARSGCSTAVWLYQGYWVLGDSHSDSTGRSSPPWEKNPVYGVWPESRERHATPKEHHWVRSVHFTARGLLLNHAR
jgi:hypothetical protein